MHCSQMFAFLCFEHSRIEELLEFTGLWRGEKKHNIWPVKDGADHRAFIKGFKNIQ